MENAKFSIGQKVVNRDGELCEIVEIGLFDGSICFRLKGATLRHWCSESEIKPVLDDGQS